MKKYARLRQDCLEFDNAVYDATAEGSLAGGSTRSGLTLTGALKKLGSFREVGASRRQTAAQEVSESGRWANAETASLSGRWGSVSTTDHWDDVATPQAVNSFRDSRSGRLEAGEPWSAALKSSSPSPAPVPPEAAIENPNPSDQPLPNISMKETQGWLGSMKRPARKPCEDASEFNWRAATSTSCSRKGTVSQSMRYDRLRTMDLVDAPAPVTMQKAASMREGGAHSDAILAMARAYSEKHGVAQAILECVACGRALGVVVQGNPGSDTSFCHSCRPLRAWTFPPSLESPHNKPKRKGMMHYFCRKILRLGKKPNKSKP